LHKLRDLQPSNGVDVGDRDDDEEEDDQGVGHFPPLAHLGVALFGSLNRRRRTTKSAHPSSAEATLKPPRRRRCPRPRAAFSLCAAPTASAASAFSGAFSGSAATAAEARASEEEEKWRFLLKGKALVWPAKERERSSFPFIPGKKRSDEKRFASSSPERSLFFLPSLRNARRAALTCKKAGARGGKGSN